MGSCFLTSCQIGNMKGVCVYFASILLGLTVIVNCSEESRLKRHLLFEYDRNTKPSEQVVVEIGMRPTNLNLCPHSQTLTLQTWNTYKWKDSRLAWTPTDWNNITTLKFSRQTIWVPDVLIFKIVDEVKQFGDFQYIVSSDGSVLYIPIEIHKIFCAVNYDNLPFGAQACEFKIGSWQYDESDIDLKVYSGSTPEFWNPHYEITKLDVEREEKVYPKYGSYPRLAVDLEFKRKAMYQNGELKTE